MNTETGAAERTGCIADLKALAQMAAQMGDDKGSRAILSAAEALNIRE